MKTTAADSGEATMAIWEATTATDRGREGRTPPSLATSTMTGSVENAVWPVPAKTVISHVTTGAHSVIWRGLRRRKRSARWTR